MSLILRSKIYFSQIFFFFCAKSYVKECPKNVQVHIFQNIHIIESPGYYQYLYNNDGCQLFKRILFFFKCIYFFLDIKL